MGKSAQPTLLQGTLDLLILHALQRGAMHGYAISQAILRQTDEALLVEEGALYPALYRMEGKGWLEAEWGVSENNRRAKYYRLTPKGRAQLRLESATWTQFVNAVAKVLGATEQPA